MTYRHIDTPPGARIFQLETALERAEQRISTLRDENERLREIASAAKNLVENSYVPSCDGDRQRWLMLKAAIDAARSE